jgi:hypothetical protein
MKMRLMLLAASVTALTISPATAWAQNEPPILMENDIRDGGETVVTFAAEVEFRQPSQSTRSPTAPPLSWASHPTWAQMPDGSNGGICVGTRWVAAEEQSDANALAAEGNQYFFNLWSNLLSFNVDGMDPTLVCPAAEADPLPLVVVRDAVEELVRGQLPRPVLEIPPGRALTGMPAYLVTNHELAHVESYNISIGAFPVGVDVAATGMTTVDWGDGTVGTYDVAGTPYPDGQVHHTYQETGQVTVTVTDRWVVDFTVSGPVDITDQITAELETVSLEHFTVNQVQAVRVNPGR